MKSNSYPTFQKAPTKRQSISLIESDHDDDGISLTPENDENLLGQYTNMQKRFKDDSELEHTTSDEKYIQNLISIGNKSPPKQETATTIRNPFKKPVQDMDVLLSPTKITKENSSLVKTQSPVKCIDFTKIGKISRFNRTYTPPVDKERVISKFFPSATNVRTDVSVQVNVVQCDESNGVDEQLTPPYDDKPNRSPPPFTSDDEEEPEESNASKDDNNEPLTKNRSIAILEQFKFSMNRLTQYESSSTMETNEENTTNDKTDSESKELPIVLSDDSIDNIATIYPDDKSIDDVTHLIKQNKMNDKSNSKWVRVSQ